MKDKLQKRIRELVPELMELSFGCEIGNEKNLPIQYIGNDNGQHALILTREDGKTPLLFVDKIEGEIIGHPIHLEHIVQSIIAKKHETRSAVFYVLIGEISCLYKYNKPFTNQSPELYEFLSDILIKE